MESMMLFVRREFLQLVGAIVMTSATSEPTEGAAGPSSIEILRSDLTGHDHRVAETLVAVVSFPPGSVSTWHVHPGAQELVFALQGKLTLEIDGRGAKSIGVGETGLIPADVAHTVRNETDGEPARILVVYSRSDKTSPLRVDVNKA
jgi:quercetin dioxygenase-like cupin family protein